MATHKASHGAHGAEVHKTVGVYEKPATGAAGIPRPALYVGAVALAVGLGAAALYWL